jgi:hypothetical protein
VVFFAIVSEVCIAVGVTVVVGIEIVISGNVVETGGEEVVITKGSGARKVIVAEDLVFPSDSFPSFEAKLSCILLRFWVKVKE